MAENSLYQGSTYFDLILQGLRRWPDREAIVDASGLSLTYSELEHRIWRIARVLRDAGLVNQRAVMQEHRAEWWRNAVLLAGLVTSIVLAVDKAPQYYRTLFG